MNELIRFEDWEERKVYKAKGNQLLYKRIDNTVYYKITSRSEWEKAISDINYIISTKWEEIEKPITWQKALESHYVRCEHEFLNELNDINRPLYYISEPLKQDVKQYKKGEYIAPSNMLSIISTQFSGYEIKRILTDGKWYTRD